MPGWGWLAVLAAVAWVVHLVMRALERRGRVRWTEVDSHAWGGLVDGLPDAFNPGHQHRLDQRAWEEVRVAEAPEADPLSALDRAVLIHDEGDQEEQVWDVDPDGGLTPRRPGDASDEPQ